MRKHDYMYLILCNVRMVINGIRKTFHGNGIMEKTSWKWGVFKILKGGKGGCKIHIQCGGFLVTRQGKKE